MIYSSQERAETVAAELNARNFTKDSVAILTRHGWTVCRRGIVGSQFH